MKIALVVHDLHEHGGHSLYARVLADALASRHEVTVFANQCERPANALWHFSPVTAWRVNALASVRTFPLGLRRWRRELAGYDIQHSQGYCGGAPNLVTAHICLASYLDSLCGISTRTRASLGLMLAAEERFYRQYHGHVIALSNRMAEDLRERYGVRSPISVVPHGINTARFTPGNRDQFRQQVRAELGISEDRTLALYVGDLTKAHTHLKAMAAVTPDVEFIAVTKSQQYHWPAANVRILSPTREIERYYAAADAFVFPTTYDAFGMVVLEAMASGIPVFCSDQAGAAELITSGLDSVVLSLDDWVEGARDGLRDRARLATLGGEASRMAQRHQWPSVTEVVEQIYFEVVQAQVARRA